MASQPTYATAYLNSAGGSAGPPPPPYPGPGVHAAARVSPPGPQYPGPRDPRAPVVDLPPPPYPGPTINPGGGGGGPRTAADKRSREAHAADVVQPETKKLRWAMFIVGNLVSAAGIVSEVGELNVCFDENLSDDDDPPEESANETFHVTMFLLIFGLLVDVSSAIILSVIYRSPLDIKSVRKIPPEDMRQSFAAVVAVKVLAPLVWCFVYFAGGAVSMNYGENAVCGGGAGGLVLGQYLEASGAFMVVFGLFMLGVSVKMCPVACGTASPEDGCCGYNRDAVHKRVLSLGPVLDGGWQLQGVLLSYRAGALSPTMAFVVASLAVVGEALAAFGSFASEAVREVVGPIGA